MSGEAFPILRAREVDEQEALMPEWSQRYIQLETGQFEGTLQALPALGPVTRFRKTTNRKLQKSFETPHHRAVLAFLAERCAPARFQGKVAGPGAALWMAPGEHLDLHCHGHFDVLVACIPLDELSVSGERRPACAGMSSDVLSAEDAAMLHRLFARPPADQDADCAIAQLESCLSLGAQQRARTCVTDPLAELALRAAQRIVWEEADRQGAVPGVEELADRIGVSVRLLHETFRRRLGVSPQRYATSVRLSRARADLRSARGRRATVAEIAARWGFWHLGRFASTYRDMFGELPSQTLGG